MDIAIFYLGTTFYLWLYHQLLYIFYAKAIALRIIDWKHGASNITASFRVTKNNEAG
jgi:hypothetical protein